MTQHLLANHRTWKIIILLLGIFLALFAGWLLSGSNSLSKTAGEKDSSTPADISETPIGKFECTVNTDCPADKWCYVTKDFAACTKK